MRAWLTNVYIRQTNAHLLYMVNSPEHTLSMGGHLLSGNFGSLVCFCRYLSGGLTATFAGPCLAGEEEGEGEGIKGYQELTHHGFAGSFVLLHLCPHRAVEL